MQTIDSSKAAENVTGSDGAIHIPSNPTLAGLASLTRNVAYKTGADDLVTVSYTHLTLPTICSV